MHEMVKPLQWLMGTWKSISAKVMYPTMKTVDFEEKLCFLSAGQPLLNYSSTTWNPKDKAPMHLEYGYLRIDEEGCLVALLTAMNFGISTVEEGTLQEKSLTTNSKSIAHTKFAKMPVVALQRCYCLNDKCQLSYILKMQTERTPLSTHLECLYEKEEEKS
nr:THAP domain-containing protein 4-like [Leptinotarsa decemlineata]